MPIVIPLEAPTGMSSFDAFSPYVLPYAPGCPDATIEHHVRMAAIEFCRHTNVWRADLAGLAGDGVATEFTMPLPTDAEVSKLLGVAITATGYSPTDATIRTADVGARMVRDGTTDTIAYTDDLRTLTVWPAQATGKTITATVSLKPSMTAATFPDALFAHYAQDIAAGALASILAMPKKDWTDVATAGIKQAEFNAKKASTARKVERGFSSSTRRCTTRWY